MGDDDLETRGTGTLFAMPETAAHPSSTSIVDLPQPQPQPPSTALGVHASAPRPNAGSGPSDLPAPPRRPRGRGGSRAPVGSVAGPRVRESLPARVEVEEDSQAARLLGEVWDHAASESLAHARQLRRVIALSEELCEGPVGEGRESFDREACEYALAQALRSTIGGPVNLSV